jgi:HD-like signal output (HDOD) protein
MTPPDRNRAGSALNTGLYVLEAEELAEVQRELQQQDPLPPLPQKLDPRELPREVRLRVSAMIASGEFEPPRLPEIAVQVLQKAEDPKGCAEDLAGLVHRDAFLAGRLLAAANSAMFRPRDRTITRLPEAVARMGVRQVRNIILAAAMEQTVYRGPHKALMAELWQASLGAAVGCRLVSSLMRRDADRAFMLGLVSDVGKPVIAWCMDEVLGQRVDHEEFQRLAEPIFHQLHPRVGGMIVSHWNLPPGLATVVNHHHDPTPPDAVKGWAKVLRISSLLYECWRDSPEDFDEEGMLNNHALLVRSFREPRTVRRLLNLYPSALETLLHG